jgi:hypothetical protein
MDITNTFKDQLEKYLHIDSAQSDVVHDLLIGEADPMDNEAVQRWVRQCYNKPSDQELLQAALDDVIDSHGVEGVSSMDIEFLNTGDAYTGTLLWHEGDVYLTTYGDAVESLERGETLSGKIDIDALQQAHEVKFAALSAPAVEPTVSNRGPEPRL